MIGAGIMGAGIAAANVKRGVPATLTDANHDVLDQSVGAILKEVSFNKKTRKADLDRALKLAPLLNATVSDAEVASADIVIEAVVENADVKRPIYKRLEPKLRPDAILASNTSTIPITQLAADLAHPERFCGIHFFNPVRQMKLVEVIVASGRVTRRLRPRSPTPSDWASRRSSSTTGPDSWSIDCCSLT